MSRRQKSKADEAREVLSNLIYSHVAVTKFNFHSKVAIIKNKFLLFPNPLPQSNQARSYMLQFSIMISSVFCQDLVPPKNLATH